MERDRTRIFRLIETADNFIKYARPGTEARAAARARVRYQKAAHMALAAGDEEMVAQVALRLEDLDRRPAPTPEDSTTGEPGPPDPTTATHLPGVEPARVPPNQRVTRGWPVLHEGPIPRFDEATWRLRVHGACGRPLELTYAELKALPNVDVITDFHCVTGWSKLDNVWTGVRAREVLDRATPDPDATHVAVQAEHSYEANLPAEVFQRDDVLLAWAHDGQALAPKHGFPLRLIVPHLYAWKSVKWVRGFELLTADRRGYWERRGYHNRADPWREERYAYQETAPS